MLKLKKKFAYLVSLVNLYSKKCSRFFKFYNLVLTYIVKLDNFNFKGIYLFRYLFNFISLIFLIHCLIIYIILYSKFIIYYIKIYTLFEDFLYIIFDFLKYIKFFKLYYKEVSICSFSYVVPLIFCLVYLIFEKKKSFRFDILFLFGLIIIILLVIYYFYNYFAALEAQNILNEQIAEAARILAESTKQVDLIQAAERAIYLHKWEIIQICIIIIGITINCIKFWYSMKPDIKPDNIMPAEWDPNKAIYDPLAAVAPLPGIEPYSDRWNFNRRHRINIVHDRYPERPVENLVGEGNVLEEYELFWAFLELTFTTIDTIVF